MLYVYDGTGHGVQMTTEPRELAVIEGQYKDIVPVMSPADAKAAMQAYQEMVEAVTDEKDYQTFKDSDQKSHKFRKRSGWKKLDWAYGVTSEVKDERIFHEHNPAKCLRVRMPENFKDVVDCGCPVKGVRYVVRAIKLSTGRYAENIGICVAGERRVPASASLHDLATRALNRGKNRATADLLGVSDPSAEEKQIESGFSKEERVELSNLWKAHNDRTAFALTALDEMGFDGPTDSAAYVDFLQRGTEEQYEKIRGILTGAGEEQFDPDDIPMEVDVVVVKR